MDHAETPAAAAALVGVRAPLVGALLVDTNDGD
jgi:hypothetical protein